MSNYFFALTLSDEARRQAAQSAEQWRSQLPGKLRARWYDPQDYHVTLKFLGEISFSEAQRAVAAVHAAKIAQRDDFNVMLAAQGAFPNLQTPRVLWQGIETNFELSKLAGDLNNAVGEAGFARETRSFKPHITLARCSGTPKDEVKTCHEQVFVLFKAKYFVLMETLPAEMRTKIEKSRYNIVRAFPFRSSSNLIEREDRTEVEGD